MGTRKGETDILQGFHVKLTPMSFCFTPTLESNNQVVLSIL